MLSGYDDRKEYYDFLTESKFTLLSEPHSYDNYPEPVLNQELNWEAITQTYEKEKLVVVDNFLRPDIARRLRTYILYLNVRQALFPDYAVVNFYKSAGSLWFPLLTNIVDECKDKFSFLDIHAFIRAWSFIYADESNGITPHADPAAINFNLWVTDNECVINPDEQNGLDIWNVCPPENWTWDTYNRDIEAITEFLSAQASAKTSVAYRFNRVTIFNSKFFHKSQPVRTQPGYKNRRVNYTFLFGGDENDYF